MSDYRSSNVDIGSRDADESIDTHLVIVGSDKNVYKNSELMSSLKYLQYPYEIMPSRNRVMEAASHRDRNCVFVLEEFDGALYEYLKESGARIMGAPVLVHSARQKVPLVTSSRPIYSTTMHSLVVCFTGFKVKDELVRLVELVHHLGGSIRKDFSSRVTHLVANCTMGEKYRAAVSLGTRIMTEDWVRRCWELRDDYSIEAADDPALADTRMRPFCFSVLSFYGFSEEDRLDMQELTVTNGGTCVEPGATCTHLVIDDSTVKTIPFAVSHKTHIVKSEWFWGSIQMDACGDESIYRFDEILDTPQGIVGTPHGITGASKSRKRKRLRENLAQLANDGDIDSPFRAGTSSTALTAGVAAANGSTAEGTSAGTGASAAKRRSNELARMSFSASFLDATVDSSMQDSDLRTPLTSTCDTSKMSSRQLTAMELLQTETNYVSILHTILHTFKAEIELQDQPGGPLLDQTDVKLIFGKLPPIHDVHTKIRDELAEICHQWTEQSLIGEVFVSHAEELMKAYPPFINFVEQTKDTIAHCDKTKPRFHAFLKVCMSKPECGRQSLAELLIRPVQRLPSICLLLKDILRRTDKSHADYNILELAKRKLDGITSHINEDKRKTEGHQAMFDVINDIDNCPPNLLASYRTLVTKIDCLVLTQTNNCSKGDQISLFVFTDSIEMVRRRGKALSSKSPAAKTPQKPYKHLELIYCKDIKKVADINDTIECRMMFALIVRELNKEECRLFSFMIMDDEVNKAEFLRSLSKVISNNTCRADYENLLTVLDVSALQIDTSDISSGTLGRVASKFSRRVSRAFSFNKTPRKLKRAMSSMSQVMSPFRRDSISITGSAARDGTLSSANSLRDSTLSITPSNFDTQSLRLESVNDLNEEECVTPSRGASPMLPRIDLIEDEDEVEDDDANSDTMSYV